MEKQLVSFDVAKAEVERWQDAKRLTDKKRESLSSMAENMIEGVVTGVLVIDEETNVITQTLVFPEGTGATELKYKLRITEKDKEPYKRLIKGDSFADELTRTILALTGAPINTVRQLDASTDRPLAEAIATFFFVIDVIDEGIDGEAREHLTDAKVEVWIKSCISTFKWTPHYCIESLYLDDADFYGLKYWHDVAMEIDKSIRETQANNR